MVLLLAAARIFPLPQRRLLRASLLHLRACARAIAHGSRRLRAPPLISQLASGLPPHAAPLNVWFAKNEQLGGLGQKATPGIWTMDAWDLCHAALLLHPRIASRHLAALSCARHSPALAVSPLISPWRRCALRFFKYGFARLACALLSFSPSAARCLPAVTALRRNDSPPYPPKASGRQNWTFGRGQRQTAGENCAHHRHRAASALFSARCAYLRTSPAQNGK